MNPFELFPIGGITFRPAPHMLRTVMHQRERKWSRRLKHERWRRFDTVGVEMKPSRMVIVSDGVAFAHPDTIEAIKAGVEPI